MVPPLLVVVLGAADIGVSWASTFATLHLRPFQVNLIINDLRRSRPSMLDPLRDLPLLRETYQEGVLDGESKGRAEDLLEILADREIPIGEEARSRILSCQ